MTPSVRAGGGILIVACGVESALGPRSDSRVGAGEQLSELLPGEDQSVPQERQSHLCGRQALEEVPNASRVAAELRWHQAVELCERVKDRSLEGVRLHSEQRL